MIWLSCSNMSEEVTDENTYAVALQNIKTGISGQTNQAMTRYTLHTTRAGESAVLMVSMYI